MRLTKRQVMELSVLVSFSLNLLTLIALYENHYKNKEKAATLISGFR
jgi:hypothetical protein